MPRFWLPLLAAILLASMSAFDAHAEPDQAPDLNAAVSADAVTSDLISAAATQTFALSAASVTDAEISNPLRGQYEWYGMAAQPNAWPMQDVYARYTWRQLEPSEGQYDFSAIDQLRARAIAHNGHFSFGVMPLDSFSGGKQVPDYVATASNGWSISAAGRQAAFVPDWNSAEYLTRWTALMHALGARYGQDPNLGVVDIRGYGDWGEWHLSWFGQQYPGPNGQQPITDEHARQIVDATVDAFPDRLLVMLTANEPALRYALSRSPRVGVRVDCLGGSSDMSGAAAHMRAVPESLDRWKTAPVETEWCNNDKPGAGVFTMGAQQVRDFHVSLLSSGNFFTPFGQHTAAEQAAFVEANKSAGYRFVLDDVSIPATVSRGNSVQVTSHWENVNVAPAYEAWNAHFQLRDSAGQGVWDGTSGVDFRGLLPTNGTPTTYVDTFSLPAQLAPGTYEVALVISDPSGVSGPLQLGNSGRRSDGSYHLAVVTLS